MLGGLPKKTKARANSWQNPGPSFCECRRGRVAVPLCLLCAALCSVCLDVLCGGECRIAPIVRVRALRRAGAHLPSL